MMKRIKPVTIELEMFADSQILVFNGIDEFNEYTEEYDLMCEDNVMLATSRKCELAEVQGSTGAFYHRDKNNKSDIKDGYLYFLLINKPSADVVVHETAHLVMYIFEGLGIPLSVDNSETFCYMQDWLFKKVCEIFNIAGCISDEEWGEINKEVSNDNLKIQFANGETEFVETESFRTENTETGFSITPFGCDVECYNFGTKVFVISSDSGKTIDIIKGKNKVYSV